MMRWLAILLLSVQLVVLAGHGATAMASAPMVAESLYLAPDGDDSRSGRTPEEALRTLARVQAMLKAGTVEVAETGLTIRLLPGVYRTMGVVWDYAAPGRRITLEPAGAPHSAVIEGRGDALGQFFLLRLTGQAVGPVNTGITIRGLVITDFCEGISLGDWKSTVPVAGNVIENNKFRRIGSRYETSRVQPDGQVLPDGKCFAALRVSNAHGSVIRDNVFTDIENVPVRQTGTRRYGPTLLHAIYINGSTGSRVEGNQFSRFTGSPVRVRDGSDDTIVVGNSFEEPLYGHASGKPYVLYAVSQWYCNEGVEVCRQRAEAGRFECPSVGIQIIGNRASGKIEMYGDNSQSRVSTCPPERVPAGSIDPILHGNILHP